MFLLKREYRVLLMLSEKQLIQGCRKGERQAQKELYDCYAPMMMGISMRYCKSTQEAEDVVQEAFMKVYDNIKQFKGEGNLVFWIRRIVINTALNSERGKMYLFPMVDVRDINVHTEKDFSLRDYSFQDLLKLINQLPDGCRAIFNLYAIEGYSHKEIGEILSISEGTSKSQYARAKQLLRAKLLKENRINYGNG